MAARPKISVVGRRQRRRHRRPVRGGDASWATSCSSTSSRACRRARRSTSPRRARSRAMTPRSSGTNGYEETADSDIVVITAGIARKPGMSRDDLLITNAEIVGSVVEQVVARARPTSIVIVVTNPLDAMVQVAWKKSGFPRRARDRHGRRARHRPLPHVHRQGAGRLGGERHRVRARRPRRHDGAAAALLHGGRHPDHRAAVRRSGSTPSSRAPPTAAPRSWSC